MKLFFANSELNDVTMQGDFYVSVPAGIYVYGQGMVLPIEIVSMPISLQIKFALVIALMLLTPVLEPSRPIDSYSGPTPSPTSNSVLPDSSFV